MKKSIILFLAIVLIQASGCKKEGPIGPAGPTGPQGPAGTSGSSIVAIDTFTVQTAQWVMTSSAYYKFVHSNSAITQQIVDVGSLNVYVKDYLVNNSWFALPDVVAGGSGYRFSYDLGIVTLYADNFSSGVPRPLRFKVVIMK